MKSWAIFQHSLKMIIRHWTIALRITLPFALITLLFQAVAPIRDISPQAETSTFSIVINIAIFMYGCLSYLWIAVLWHRYILLGEHPKPIPKFWGANIASYFGKSFLICLVTLPALMPLALATMILKNLTYDWPWLSIAFGAIGSCFVAIVFLRLSSILPGAAIDCYHSLHDAVAATKGQSLTILGVGIILTLSLMPLHIISVFIESAPAVVASLWNILSGFAEIVIYISAITTLYSYYVEKKSMVI